MTSPYQPKQWHTKYYGINLQNLGPFMILPVTGSAQIEAMWFFEYVSIKHLNEYRPCESWRKILMFFSQTVPSVRYAAVALALIHRNHMDRHSSDRVYQPQSLDNWLPSNAPLLHYNRAIQLLLNQQIGDSPETTAITLLVCYLFTCFDHLAGNYIQAMKHLRGGVDISRKINKAIMNKNNAFDDAQLSGVRTLIYQVTRQISRLDIQAAYFLVDWIPTNIQETHMSQLLPSDSAFRFLDQAADYLQILVARVMKLRNSEQQISPTGEMLPSPSSSKDIVLGQLEMWSSLFENMLRQCSSYMKGPEAYPLISLLRLHYTIAWTILSSYGPGREMEYDNFLPQFQYCVNLAGDVAVAYERHLGSLKPTFTPEIGIVPVLYIIGVKCRHSVIRRKALSILRFHPIQEAVWDSISVARVVERVIEIEEGRSDKGEQIAVWQRIETFSWVHVVNRQSAPDHH